MLSYFKKIIPVNIKRFIKNPIKFITNYYWIFYVKHKKINKINIKYYPEKENIVVSVTSYGKRLNDLYISLKSILLQSVRPNKVLLYLGNDVKKEDLPLNLIKLEKDNLLEIIFKKENLMSYKKFVYALQEYSNDIIITIDDDLIYEKKMIELLINSYNKYPNCLSAKRVHKITYNDDGNLLPYSKWKKDYNKCNYPADDLFATTGAGTLFPPNFFSNISNIIYNDKIFMNICPKADDVWIKFMCILSKKKVVYVKGKNDMPLIIKGTQDTALFNDNVDMNDVYIKKVSEYFKIKI